VFNNFLLKTEFFLQVFPAGYHFEISAFMSNYLLSFLLTKLDKENNQCIREKQEQRI